MKALYVIGLGLVIVCLVGLDYLSKKKVGHILETWEVARGPVRVKVTAFSEKNSYVPGAFYVYEATNDLGKTIPIMTFRHDDPMPIDKNSVVFISDEIAYVFLGWIYGVTTDAGKSWSIWNAEKEWVDFECCNYSLIKKIEIDLDGTGTMELGYDGRNKPRTVVYTKDHGRTWTTDPRRESSALNEQGFLKGGRLPEHNSTIWNTNTILPGN